MTVTSTTYPFAHVARTTQLAEEMLRGWLRRSCASSAPPAPGPAREGQWPRSPGRQPGTPQPAGQKKGQVSNLHACLRVRAKHPRKPARIRGSQWASRATVARPDEATRAMRKSTSMGASLCATGRKSGNTSTCAARARLQRRFGSQARGRAHRQSCVALQHDSGWVLRRNSTHTVWRRWVSTAREFLFGATSAACPQAPPLVPFVSAASRRWLSKKDTTFFFWKCIGLIFRAQFNTFAIFWNCNVVTFSMRKISF